MEGSAGSVAGEPATRCPNWCGWSIARRRRPGGTRVRPERRSVAGDGEVNGEHATLPHGVARSRHLPRADGRPSQVGTPAGCDARAQRLDRVSPGRSLNAPAWSRYPRRPPTSGSARCRAPSTRTAQVSSCIAFQAVTCTGKWRGSRSAVWPTPARRSCPITDRLPGPVLAPDWSWRQRRPRVQRRGGCQGGAPFGCSLADGPL